MLIVWEIVSQEKREYIKSEGQEFNENSFLLEHFSSDEVMVI